MAGTADTGSSDTEYASVHPFDAGVASDAFHGTSSENANNIIASQAFVPSGEGRNHLGRGVYFFIGDPDAALAYARGPGERYLAGPRTVLRVVVELGRTVNSWLLGPMAMRLKTHSRFRDWTDEKRMRLVIDGCRAYITNTAAMSMQSVSSENSRRSSGTS